MLVHVVNSPKRAVVLEQDGFALVMYEGMSGVGLQVELLPVEQCRQIVDEAGQRIPTAEAKRSVLGCLGLLRVGAYTYVVLASTSLFLGSPTSILHGFGTEQVWSVRTTLFYCLEGTEPGPERLDNPNHPCHKLDKFLEDGTFYYTGTEGFDITLRLAERLAHSEGRRQACEPVARSLQSPLEAEPSELGDMPSDPKFLYNNFLLLPLFHFRNSLSSRDRHEFDQRGFAVPLIRGYCASVEVQYVGENALLTVISRRGWERAGTRFHHRGVDSKGNVGNFAETEVILRTQAKCFSFVQVRGSVPVYWTERGTLSRTPDVTIAPDLRFSLEPLKLHFNSLLDRYGPVEIIDLMSTKIGSIEEKLGAAYAGVLQKAQDDDEKIRTGVDYHSFDLSKERAKRGLAKVPNRLAEATGKRLASMGATVVEVGEDGRAVTSLQKQEAVYRINCRDCLDRTGLVVALLGAEALRDYVRSRGFTYTGSQVEQRYRNLAAENADALARIYAGSPGMHSRFIKTGKVGHQSIIDDLETWAIRVKQYKKYDKEKDRQTALFTGAALEYQGLAPPPVVLRSQLAQLIPE